MSLLALNLIWGRAREKEGVWTLLMSASQLENRNILLKPKSFLSGKLGSGPQVKQFVRLFPQPPNGNSHLISSLLFFFAFLK